MSDKDKTKNQLLEEIIEQEKVHSEYIRTREKLS